MVTKEKWLIPEAIMVDAVQKTVDWIKGNPGIDNWGEKEKCLCRSFLPEEYRHIETDILARYAGNIRRNPKKFSYEAPNKKMGRSKSKKPLSDSYNRYMDSDEWGMWKELSFWPFWEGVFGERKCVMCTAKTNLEPHHRHYQTFENESPTDCVPVCRSCHDKHHED